MRKELKMTVVLGIAGGSGSGKTTLAHRLVEQLGPKEAGLISVDSYYHCNSGLSAAQKARCNYDHPDSIDWELLKEHLATLRKGNSVTVPQYDFSSHERRGPWAHFECRPFTIIEGILALHSPALCDSYDLKVYVATNDELRFSRRRKRDVQERGRTNAAVQAQWETTVLPMHQHFCEPSRDAADIVVSGETHDEHCISDLVDRLKSLRR